MDPLPAIYQFEKIDLGSVEFRSSWADKIQSDEATCQTRPLMVYDEETQTVEMKASHTQTELQADEKTADDDGDKKGFQNLPSHISNAMKNLVNNMEDALHSNMDSHAFDDYTLQLDDMNEGVTLMHSLEVDLSKYIRGWDSKSPLECTGISWNARGTLIAGTYGRLDMCGWCDLPGALVVWSIFKRNFAFDKPETVIEHSSCLMCSAYHPLNPSLIVVGSYNGEILVYDLSNTDEMLIAQSRIDDYFHREPISKVSWVFDIREGDYQIASISGDGKALFWSLKNKLLCPIQGFRLAQKSKRSVSDRRGNKSIVGGTSLSFAAEGRQKNVAVVGSEGGAIYRCFLKNDTSTKKENFSSGDFQWTKEAEEALMRVPEAQRYEVKRHVESQVRDLRLRKDIDLDTVFKTKPNPDLIFPAPEDFAFESHSGPVHGIECSPFHRNIFTSCAADGSLRLYSMLQQSPLIRLDPCPTYLYSVAWSKIRPLVLAASSANGIVYIYDLAQSTNMPVAELDVTASDKNLIQNKKKAAVYGVQFNPRLRDFLATCDADGKVHIWQLSWKLANLQSSEQEYLEELAKSTFTDS